jgi:hypothetical protein
MFFNESIATKASDLDISSATDNDLIRAEAGVMDTIQVAISKRAANLLCKSVNQAIPLDGVHSFVVLSLGTGAAIPVNILRKCDGSSVLEIE